MSKSGTRSLRRGERGTVLVQVAVAMLALLAIGALVFDYGVMWVSRAQAQNAADAGALSGAISLAFDSATDFDGARAKAIAMAQRNRVWTEVPDITNADVTFPACPPGAPGLPDTCVKVDVFRTTLNRAGGNPLPTYLSRLVGVMEQGTRATATAQVVTGDTTECLRPWAVVDRWNEFGPEGFTPISTYDRYSDGRGNNPPQENDVYTPPSPSGPGTGYTLPADEGRRFAIKVGAGGSISSGWFRTIDLPRADTTQLGNNTVQTNILSCNGMPASFVSPDTVCPTSIPNNWTDTAYWAARGCFRVQTGATVGSTANSIETLVARDSGARWVDGQGIVGSAYSPPTSSPRVVPIGVLDIDWYLSLDPTGQNGVARLVNIYGFFIEGVGDVDRDTGAIIFPSRNGQAVIGRIMTVPSMASGSSSLPNNASFLRTIILVR